MKRILFVALAATLLAAGCQKTEIINSVRGDAMTFTTAMGKLTKANVPDADSTGVFNLQRQNFKVWAYCAYKDENNGKNYGDVYDSMSALDVTCDTTTGAWSTELTYYWPGTNKKLDFFAVSTGATWKQDATPGIEWEIENGGVDTIGVNVRKLHVKGYTVDKDNPNDDLMVAEFVRQDQDMNDKNVKLHFKHALAKVQFKFLTNAEDDEVFVDTLIVSNLRTIGNLTVSETAETYGENDKTGRVKVNLSWEPVDTAGVVAFSDDYSGSLKLRTTADEYATWLVLPQDISNKTVKIAYTINDRSFEQTFALTRPAVAEVKNGDEIVTPGQEAFASWDINQVVIYTINLSPNKITFVPSVEDWKTPADNLTDQN